MLLLMVVLGEHNPIFSAVLGIKSLRTTHHCHNVAHVVVFYLILMVREISETFSYI